MESGRCIFKFFCLQSGCQASFSKTSSSTTLSYHIKAKHHAEYIAMAKKKSIEWPPISLIQTSLDMAPVSKAKRDKTLVATLDWLVGDLLPFSTLDSERFRAMIRTYTPNQDPPCAATAHASLLDYCIKLTERLKDLTDRTLLHGSITVDSWTSQSNKSYFGITLHWLDDDFKQYECALDLVPQPHPHTAANTACIICKGLQLLQWVHFPIIFLILMELSLYRTCDRP